MSQPVEVACFIEPSFGENAYVVFREGCDTCFVVDPGLPPSGAKIVEFIREKELKLEGVILSHGHLDHIAGVVELHEAFPDAPIYMAHEETAALTDPQENLSAGFGLALSVGELPTKDLVPGETITLVGLPWKILDTSGHSPGGRSLYSDIGLVFDGDALIPGSIGRSDFHHSNEEDLYRNIRENLYTLPDETEIYSGHGPVSTIGHEKKTNPCIRP